MSPHPPTPSPVRGRGGEGSTLRATLRLPKSSEAIRESARRHRIESTGSEQILWRALRAGGLEGRKFRRQHPVDRFVLDFYCHQEHLAIEIDGRIHDTTIEQDHERQLALESLGIRFLRLPAVLVEGDLNSALQLIREAFVSANLPSPAHGRGVGGEGS
jgi:very-short-patch-repair endonuclease